MTFGFPPPPRFLQILMFISMRLPLWGIIFQDGVVIQTAQQTHFQLAPRQTLM